MAITTNTETLSTTAEQIVDAGGSDYRDKSTAVIKNNDSSITIYLGGSDAVTSADGFPLAPGEALVVDLAQNDDLWAIAASGTPTVSVLLTRVGVAVSDD